MNLSELGAIGEIVGGLGVVVTLGYLAYQMRQNTAQLKSDAYQRHLDTYRSHFSAVTLNRDVVGVLNRGLNDYDSMSGEDQMMFHGAIQGFVLAYQANRRLREEGILDERDYEMWERDIVRLLLTNGGSQWWRDLGHVYWDEFREHIEALLKARGSEVPGVNEMFAFVEPRREQD